MHIKTTILGLFLYAAMSLYFVAMITNIAAKIVTPQKFSQTIKKLALLIYALGFIAAVAAFITRWNEVKYVPMRNMFEVFIFLAAAVFPISMFAMKYLNIKNITLDMLLGIIILFPVAFIFPQQSAPLPPILQSPWFIPHVTAYMLAYIIMAKAATQAIAYYFSPLLKIDSTGLEYETAAYKLVCAGFPLLTAGLILGAFWGKFAWAIYWHWDPKETSSLVCWLTFAIYLHVRYAYGKKYPAVNCLLVILGLFFIICTLLVVNLSKIFPGLHNYA